MKLDQIAAALKVTPLTGSMNGEATEVTAGFVSDLLSDVLANAPKGGVLITVQVHLNVIAVALHAELAGVIFAAGRRPEQAVIERAMQEKLTLLACDEPAFEVVGKLYQMGLKGC